MSRYVDACSRSEWTIGSWAKAGHPDFRLAPFRCRSWRHPGECREWCFACDFARTLVALKAHTHWTFIVLTYSHRAWMDPQELFIDGVRHWSALRKRIHHRYKKFGYIQTWEVHKDNYPHVNILLSSERLHDAIERDFRKERDEWWIPAATACNFGPVMYLRPMLSATASAWYISKNANELLNAKVKDQLPVNAPPHFRRIRASRGMLPPRAKDVNRTGSLFYSEFAKLQKERESGQARVLPTDASHWQELDDGSTDNGNPFTETLPEGCDSHTQGKDSRGTQVQIDSGRSVTG